jgi:orotidine-5'-phosphate decarboxylase
MLADRAERPRLRSSHKGSLAGTSAGAASSFPKRAEMASGSGFRTGQSVSIVGFGRFRFPSQRSSDPQVAQQTWLSTKPIPAWERLIFPLDVPSNEEASDLVRRLADAVHFYKIGLELLLGGRYVDLVAFLVDTGKQVMLDAKLFDVPATVQAAVRQAAKQRVAFCTVHGNDAMLRAAVEAKAGMKILAVTALTSLDEGDLKDLGLHTDVGSLVLSRARRALEIGCDGVVSSGQEASDLRQELGHKLLIVTPGIRPVANVDDQKRTVNVEQAFLNGADYIVVGRPIRDAADPKLAAEDVQRRISTIFARQ